MAYTPPTISARTINSFGNLPKSGQDTSMTAVIPSYVQRQDATGTPVTSPQSVNGALTLAVPSNALYFVCSAPTAFDVSEDSTHTAYYTVPANTEHREGVWKIPNIYLHTGAAITISFGFELLV